MQNKKSLSLRPYRLVNRMKHVERKELTSPCHVIFALINVIKPINVRSPSAVFKTNDIFASKRGVVIGLICYIGLFETQELGFQIKYVYRFLKLSL